jgi:hypothetical protein
MLPRMIQAQTSRVVSPNARIRKRPSSHAYPHRRPCEASNRVRNGELQLIPTPLTALLLWT